MVSAGGAGIRKSTTGMVSRESGGLPGPLRDPFDRVLNAQALSRNPLLISIEALFDRYGVRRLW